MEELVPLQTVFATNRTQGSLLKNQGRLVNGPFALTVGQPHVAAHMPRHVATSQMLADIGAGLSALHALGIAHR